MRWCLAICVLHACAATLRADEASLESLIARLQHQDATVRINAAGELAEAGKKSPQRAAYYLGRALSDPHVMVRFYAAKALGDLGERVVAAAPLLAALEDPEWLVFRQAVITLGRLRLSRLVQAHVREMRDLRRGQAAFLAVRMIEAHQEIEAWQAVARPGAFPPPRVVPVPPPPEVIAMLHSLELEELSRLERLNAILKNPKLSRQDRVAQLLNQALQEPLGVSPSALSALQGIPETSQVRELAIALIRRDERAALRVLKSPDLPLFDAALQSVLRNSEGKLRDVTIGVIIRKGQKSVAAQQFLADSLNQTPVIRQYALIALEDLKLEEDVVQLLVKNLSSRQPEQVLAAIDSLGALGRKSGPALAPLHVNLKHKDPRVREAAAILLSKLDQDPAPAIEVLVESLHAEDVDARIRAAEALGRLGSRARSAARALARATEDANERVSNAALDAFVQVVKGPR